MSDTEEVKKTAPKRTLSDIDSELLKIDLFPTPPTLGE